MSSDAIVSQVLDELGLNLSDELSSKKIQHNVAQLYKFYIRSFDSHQLYHLMPLCVPLRSSNDRRKLVGSCRKEGRASGCAG